MEHMSKLCYMYKLQAILSKTMDYLKRRRKKETSRRRRQCRDDSQPHTKHIQHVSIRTHTHTYKHYRPMQVRIQCALFNLPRTCHRRLQWRR